MEELPALRVFCATALRELSAYVEDSAALTDPCLVHLAKVLCPADLQGACEERFAQHRCASPWCATAVDVNAYQRGRLQLDPVTGALRDVSERSLYCSERCCTRTHLFAASLDTTPLYLRFDPLARVMAALDALQLSAPATRAAAEPLLARRSKAAAPVTAVPRASAAAANETDEEVSDAVVVGAAEEPFGEEEWNALMSYDEDDRRSVTDASVSVPVVPSVWHALQEWSTPASRGLVLAGKVDPPHTAAGVCVQRGHRVTPALDADAGRGALAAQIASLVRTILQGEEDLDAELVRLLLGRVDALLTAMNVRVGARPNAANAQRVLHYEDPVTVLGTREGTAVLAAVLVGALEPAYAPALRRRAPRVTAEQWEMLRVALL